MRLEWNMSISLPKSKLMIAASLVISASLAFENEISAQGLTGGTAGSTGARKSGARTTGGASRTRGRQLRRNSSPVLSPYLNQVPGITNTFEGQLLMRTMPQIEAQRNMQKLQRSVETLDERVTQQEEAIQSGIGATGHTTSFMNYGRYFGGSQSGLAAN
jgi:hypothetical protein